jgi:heat shock protein HslJ
MAGARPSASPGPSATTPPMPSATTAPSPLPTPVSSPTNHPSGLDGREFVSVLVTRDDKSVVLVPGTKIRLGFSNSTLSASAGCNSMSGQYELRDGLLSVEQLATTDMGCAQNLADQDKWLADILMASPTVALDGNDLVLSSGKNEITFIDRERAEPDQPLAGITWGLTTIVTGDAASSVPEGVSATLLFDDKGGFTFNDGCNGGGGQYIVSGDTLALSNVISTQMACTGGQAAVESAVRAVLGAERIKFAIDHTTLSLHADGDPHGLQYDAAVDVIDY